MKTSCLLAALGSLGFALGYVMGRFVYEGTGAAFRLVYGKIRFKLKKRG